jgi:hypothetical protein
MNKNLISLFAATVCLAGSANAQLAFSTFGPGDTYQSGFGATISGPNGAAGWWTQGSQFTSAASGVVDVVRVATFHAAGDGSTHVQLLDDNSDLVGNWFLDFGYNDQDSNDHITSLVNPFNSVTLNAGQKYWLRMWCENDNWLGWNFALPTVPTGRVAWSQDDGANWSYADNATQMAFDITVRPVPEPATMTALGLGLAAIVARRRKKS